MEKKECGNNRITPEEELRLENQLCFHMYASARAVIKCYKPFLDKLDLTYTQYIAMIVLWERESLTAREMGRLLYLDSGTLTPLLKKLEEKGFLSRRRSEEDERNLTVTLTEKGRALKSRAAEIPAKIRERIVLNLEDASEVRRLARAVLEASK